jgi:hypothetical protein
MSYREEKPEAMFPWKDDGDVFASVRSRYGSDERVFLFHLF